MQNRNGHFGNRHFGNVYFNRIIEIGGFNELREIINRDYDTFSGKMLERYFRSKFIEEKNITRIGGYWDRKGRIEIDLITANEIEKKAEIIEVKRNATNINMEKLRKKGFYFRSVTSELKDYKISYRGLSLNDL